MKQRPKPTFILLTAVATLATACGDDTAAGETEAGSADPADTAHDLDDATSSPSATSGNADATATTGERADCTDQMILDLGLVDGAVSTGTATNEPDGDGFVSTVDGTAGGVANAPTSPWLYLRFTAAGLERVDVDDLQALESTDWDIAVKRFGVRLNSGVSGPGDVTAAVVGDMSYEAITGLPDTTSLREESLYDDDCILRDDGMGQGAPGYLLTPWWMYGGCVQTTGIPFVLELADGSRLKFVVDAYYGEGQDACNSTGAMGSGSAMFTWRWAYLS